MSSINLYKNFIASLSPPNVEKLSKTTKTFKARNNETSRLKHQQSNSSNLKPNHVKPPGYSQL